MGVVGFIIYSVIALGLGVAGWKLVYVLYEKITGDKPEFDWIYGEFWIGFIVAVVLFFGGCWINTQIGQFVASISDFEERIVTYDVKMAYFDDKQTSKSSSAQYIFWVDQDGKLHDNDRANSVKYVDSDDWKFVEIKYETIGWLKNQFYQKNNEKIMYIPYKELGYTK